MPYSDPERARTAAEALRRVQFAMWLPAWCAVCGDEYVAGFGAGWEHAR